MSPSNLTEARLVAMKLQQLLGIPIRFANLEDTPQQQHGNECGVHVCWAMKHLLERRLLVVQREQEVDMSLGGKMLDHMRMRREMVKICEQLRKEQRRCELSFSSSPDMLQVVPDTRRAHRRSWHGERSWRGRSAEPPVTDDDDSTVSAPAEDNGGRQESSFSRKILPFLHRERRYSDDEGILRK